MRRSLAVQRIRGVRSVAVPNAQRAAGALFRDTRLLRAA
jgi:hypothetical protein